MKIAFSMGTMPETKIYNLVRKLGIIKHKTRQLFFNSSVMITDN